MRISKLNLRYILLSALVVLSLSLPSCSFTTWPSKLADKVEEVATRVATEVVEIEKRVVETVVVVKEAPVEVTRIVEVEKEVLITPTPALPTATPSPATLSQLDVESQILIEVYRKVNPSVV
ncbi:MAG: hypothetical protein H8E47_11150, partial [Anaerolineales bacterium]|nr:hypothetical protein [Anaerolineales bacterium]